MTASGILNRKPGLFNDPFFDHLGKFDDNLFQSIDNDFLDPSKMLKKILKNGNFDFAPFLHPFKNMNTFPEYNTANEPNEIDSPKNVNENNGNSDVHENSIYLKNFKDVSEKNRK